MLSAKGRRCRPGRASVPLKTSQLAWETTGAPLPSSGVPPPPAKPGHICTHTHRHAHTQKEKIQTFNVEKIWDVLKNRTEPA